MQEKEKLIQLLQENRDTEYGKRYHFEQITSIEEYQRYVPITEYEDYREAVERMYQGQENVLTVYPIASYCNTSGSMGKSKKIPLSYEALRRYDNIMETYKNKYMDQYGGKRLFLNVFRSDLSKKIEKDLIFTEILYRNLYENHRLSEKQYAGGFALLFQKQSCDMLYAKIWTAFATKDLTLLESVYLYDELSFFQYMEKNWRHILEDMSQKKIDEKTNLPDNIKKMLLSLELKKDRADQIRQECEKGWKDIAIRLWPGLKLCIGISHPSYAVEDRKIHFYIGKIPVYYWIYCASECYIATAVSEGEYLFKIRQDTGFFEFKEVKKSKRESAVVDMTKVEPGRKYELILTNYSGLYRYRLGDIVQVERIDHDGIPILRVVERKDQALNIAGEKVSISQLEESIKKYNEKYGGVDDYCFFKQYDTIPASYVLYVSSSKDRQDTQIGEKIDEELCRLNCDYNDLRALNKLGCIKGFCMRFDEYQAMLKRYAIRKGHNKPRHVSHVDIQLEEEDR